jgi:LuxR family quorum sensing-dependent transcriptional regulator
MAHWDEHYDRMAALFEAPDVETLGETFSGIVGDLGGTGFGMSCFADEGQTFEHGMDRGLNGWTEYYASRNYVAQCPLARRLVASPEPFTWDELRRQSDDDAFGRRMFNEAADLGLEHGQCIPMMTRRGAYGVVFMKTEGKEASEATVSAFSTLAIAAHSRLQLLHPQALTAARLQRGLTAREHEILSWLANGKSAEDVADILGIAAATVMFHYRSVAGRYGTLNRTHTVVEAIRRGDLKIDRA